MRLAAALTCLTLACAGRQPAGLSLPPAGPLQRAPHALGEWRFIDSTLYEANSGTSYRYSRGPDIRIDVYEYPIFPQGYPCRKACAESAVAAEVEVFQASIPAIIEQSDLDSIVSGKSRSVKYQDSRWLEAGAHFPFQIFSDTSHFQSSLFLFSGRDTYLKVRATYRHGRELDAAVDSFIAHVIRTWPPPYDCPAGVATTEGIIMTATLGKSALAIAQKIEAVAESLHYSFAFADAAQGRWRTHPQFRWPTGTERESWHGTHHPGSILYVTTRTINDSTNVEVASHLACRSSQADKTSTTLPLMSGMLFITALTDSGRP